MLNCTRLLTALFGLLGLAFVANEASAETPAPDSAPSNEQAPSSTVSLFDRSYKAAMDALSQGKPKQAEAFLVESLKLTEKDGLSATKRGQATLVLADIYRGLNRFDEAEKLYKQVVASYEGKAGDELPAALNKLAGLYKAAKKPKDSLETYKRSLELVEKGHGADSVEAATVHANIGLLFQQAGRPKESEIELNTAIAMFDKKLGPNNLEAAQCTSDLALLLLSQNKDKRAIALLESVVGIFEKKLGPEDLQVATAIGELGTAYAHAGRFKEAEEQARKALALYRKKLPADSLAIAVTLSNIGSRLKSQGKFNEALDYYTQSLAIQDKKLGANSIDSLVNLNGIVSAYVNSGDYKKAEPLLRKALLIKEKQFGPKNVGTVSALKNLASCLQLEGVRTAEPGNLLTRAEDILVSVPLTKRKFVDNFISHELIEGLDLKARRARKKDEVW